MSCRSRILWFSVFDCFHMKHVGLIIAPWGLPLIKNKISFSASYPSSFLLVKAYFLKKVTYVIYVRGLSFQYLGNKNSGETKNSEKVI